MWKLGDHDDGRSHVQLQGTFNDGGQEALGHVLAIAEDVPAAGTLLSRNHIQKPHP